MLPRQTARTTVTLDPDVQALLKQAMRSRDTSFKQALNDAVRAGLRPQAAAAKRKPYVLPTYDMGELLVHGISLNHLAAELEDQELIAKLARGA